MLDEIFDFGDRDERRQRAGERPRGFRGLVSRLLRGDDDDDHGMYCERGDSRRRYRDHDDGSRSSDYRRRDNGWDFD